MNKTNAKPTALRQITSFEQWLELFHSSDLHETKLGLIHALGEARYIYDGFKSDSYRGLAQMADFLLDVADGYYIEKAHFMSRTPNSLQNDVACMAFRVLINNFFKKPKNGDAGSRWAFWEEIVGYEDGKLKEKLFWFFRRREPTGDEEVGFDTRPFQNIWSDWRHDYSKDKEDYQNSVIRTFLFELAEHVFYELEPLREGQGSLEYLWIKKLTSVDMRVRMVDYIDHYGHLWEFFSGRIGLPPGRNFRFIGIDQEVIAKLKEIALRQHVGLVSCCRQPRTLQEAVLGHSTPAFIVALHEIGIKEYKHLKASGELG